MKNIVILVCLFFSISCSQQDVTDTDGVVVPLVRESLSGAECAIWHEALTSRWSEENNKMAMCLAGLAKKDRQRASLEAKHIVSWSLPYSEVTPLIENLARFETNDALRIYLEQRKLLSGSGLEYYDDHSAPLTAMGWLMQRGNVANFDVETGSYPNGHDSLLEELAELFGPPLSLVSFMEEAPDFEDHDSPYILRASLDSSVYQQEAINHGDWYDLTAVLKFLNDIAADQELNMRIVTLPTFDQTAIVLVGPRESLAQAISEKVIFTSEMASGMEHGKEMEQQILEQLQKPKRKRGL